MEIKKIMCCCGQGLGSSMIVRMNVDEVLKKMGITGVDVSHSTLSDANPTSADLFVVGGDLEAFVTGLPNKIILNNILDKNELETKLKEQFEK
ncbi:MAG: PTS sugar transporter subunit IIB [Erysipelotrichaceae bacterium]|nr:PTS sugar transporter subunit IIB [Erysipelotrichaceae bacterium]